MLEKTGLRSGLVLLVCVFDVDHFRPVFGGLVQFFDNLGKLLDQFGSSLANKG